jgi:hypothetical protein
MTTPFDTQWLFTRGAESVTIARTAEAGGQFRLDISGPGDARVTHMCVTLADCMELQQRFDSDLMAQGYQLNRVSDRRGVNERRRHPRGRGRRR